MAVNCCNCLLMPQCFASAECLVVMVLKWLCCKNRTDCVGHSASQQILNWESQLIPIYCTLPYNSKSCFNVIQTRGSTAAGTLGISLLFYSALNELIVK